MSLQVWLPLNGNLDNQGLNNIPFTNLNATVEANGKLGKCYKCGILYANDFTLNTEEFSVCYWVKYNWIGTYNSYVVSLNNSTSTDYQFMVGGLGNGTDNSATSTYLRINASSSGKIPIPVNEWHHCCATWKGTTVSLYVDGVFDTKITGVTVNAGATHLTINGRSNSSSGSGTSNTESSEIYVNDVRIYDHCLSSKEIKEISKGLICHYKLNGKGFGNPNLINTNNPLEAGGGTIVTDKKLIIPAIDTTADTYFTINLAEAIQADVEYTLSCDVEDMNCNTNWNFPLFAQGNPISKTLVISPSASKASITFTVPATTTTIFMDDARRPSTNPNNITLSNFKLERGSVATQWIPNESEELYYLIGTCGSSRLTTNALDKWENVNGNAVLQSNGYYKVTYTGGGWWGSRYAVTLEAGKTYVASSTGYGTKTQMWFYKDGTNSKGGNINTTSTPQFLYVKYTPTVSGTYYIVCYTATDNVNYYKDVCFYECNEELDSSGYKYDGTLSESLSLVSGSPRYGECYYFNSTSKRITLPTINMTGFTNSFSISWWGKAPNYSDLMYWGFSNGNRLNYYSGLYCNTGDESSNPYYKPNTTTTIDVPSVNVWHHFVMVGDGSTNKLYMDGELYGVAKTYKGITGSSIVINGWDSSTNYKTNGYISDFRIYSTALSAEDVKELYNTSASIDKSGNIYAYEFREE